MDAIQELEKLEANMLKQQQKHQQMMIIKNSRESLSIVASSQRDGVQQSVSVNVFGGNAKNNEAIKKVKMNEKFYENKVQDNT